MAQENKKENDVVIDTDKKIEEVAKFAQMNFDGIAFIMRVLEEKGFVEIDKETKTVKMLKDTDEVG